jgi:hypothetical protein
MQRFSRSPDAASLHGRYYNATRNPKIEIEKLRAVLQSIAQVNKVGFILEQPYVSANVGGRAEFHGFLVNLTDTDIVIGGCGAGFLIPTGLHGAAFPFSYNPALPQTLSRLQVVGPIHLLSVDIPYGSVRSSDRFLFGSTAPTYSSVVDGQLIRVRECQPTSKSI